MAAQQHEEEQNDCEEGDETFVGSEPVLNIFAGIIHVLDVLGAVLGFFLEVWRVGVVVLSAHKFIVISQSQADVMVAFGSFIERSLVQNEVIFVEEEVADDNRLVKMSLVFEGNHITVVIAKTKFRRFNQDVLTRNIEKFFAFVISEYKF